jgi:biopolymer transport protein ExbD
MFSFARPHAKRTPSLTPMIDVVFLLLVFFMLAARFGQDMAVPVAAAGTGAPYQGPPRLIDVTPSGLALNGQPQDVEAVIAALPALMQSGSDPILLRARDGADLQRIVTLIEALQDAGFSQLVLVE